MVKIAIDTPEKVENLARWGVAVINRCGKISLELNKNEVGNFDFIIWEKDGEHAFTYTSSLLIRYGYRVFFAKGTTCNIKITKREDLVMFEAILNCGDIKVD